MKNENVIQINFTLSDINIHDFSITTIGVLEVKKEELTFEITTAMNFVDELQTISIGVFAKLFTEPEKKKQILHSFISLDFRIENYSDFQTGNPQELNIPPNFINNLLGIAISTTRGIIFSKTSNTILGKVVLPLINPMALAMEMVKQAKIKKSEQKNNKQV